MENTQHTQDGDAPGLPDDDGYAAEPDTSYPGPDDDGSTWEQYQDAGTFPSWL